MKSMKFNRNMAEAPKDRPILLDIGQGFPVLGRWNKGINWWHYAIMHDNWFVNEYTIDPIGWAPLPDIEYDKEDFFKFARENAVIFILHVAIPFGLLFLFLMLLGKG